MKAERRHELHQNDLAQWLGKAWTWAKAHRNHLTSGVLVVLIVLAVWVLVARYLQSREAAVFNTYQQAMGATDAEERVARLKEVADQDRNPFWSVTANLDLGDHFALQIATGANKTDVAQLKEWAQKATDAYTRATQLAQQHPALKPLAARGYIGLGQLAADARMFDEAAKFYEQALESAPEGHLAHTAATIALRQLPLIRNAPEQFATTRPVRHDVPTEAPLPESWLRSLQGPTGGAPTIPGFP